MPYDNLVGLFVYLGDYINEINIGFSKSSYFHMN